jgi:hypothetical protein
MGLKNLITNVELVGSAIAEYTITRESIKKQEYKCTSFHHFVIHCFISLLIFAVGRVCISG